MKHRSLVIFVIIVAALAVVPEAAQQLVEFKRTAAERAVRGVSNAFLNLYAQRLKGSETRPEAVATASNAVATRAEVCSLSKSSDAHYAGARRAADAREKAQPSRGKQHAQSTQTTSDAPEILLAKNHLVHLDAPVEMQVVRGLTPEISTRMQSALEGREQLAVVQKNLNSSELARVLQHFEMERAAPSPAPELPRFDKDFARKLTRQAERSVRDAERRRATHVRQLEKAGDAENGDIWQPGKGRRVKAHVIPTPPQPAADAPQPATTSTVETIIGF